MIFLCRQIIAAGLLLTLSYAVALPAYSSEEIVFPPKAIQGSVPEKRVSKYAAKSAERRPSYSTPWRTEKKKPVVSTPWKRPVVNNPYKRPVVRTPWKVEKKTPTPWKAPKSKGSSEEIKVISHFR